MKILPVKNILEQEGSWIKLLKEVRIVTCCPKKIHYFIVLKDFINNA